MSKKNYLLILLIGFLFTSCKKNEIEYQNSFEKSQQAWLDFKSTSNNSYQYTVTGSTWAGASWETTLSVTNGKVTRRHFKYTHLREDYNISEDQQEWTETEKELNSHEHTSAAATITLDEVYETAKNVWLKKRTNGKTYFEANNNGLISSCGYVEDGCQDDCFNGIKISKIEPLE